MGHKIGAAYIRVSTDDQVEYSPDSQIAKILEQAKRESTIVPPEYIFRDDGISGKSAEKRPAFQQMVAAAKESPPPFTVIYVWEYSRFARNQEESIVYKKLLAKNGVSVRSIKEPIIDSPFAPLIESIIAWMDEYYLVNLATEVRRGMKEKALRGECMGTAPFGYKASGKSFVHDEKAEIVRRIFEDYAAGKGFRKIAAELNAQGVRTNRGNPVDNRFVEYILENPVYIGKIRWSTEGHANYSRATYKGDNVLLVDGTHPPIISPDLWARVQARLKDPAREVKYTRQAQEPYMLRGLIRCSACGATLTRGGRGEHAWLQCHRYARGQCSVSHHISMRKAVDTVVAQLGEMLGAESFVFSPRQPARSAASCDWDKLIAQEQNRLRRARNALLDGAFTNVEYREIKAEIEEKISKLEESRDAGSQQEDANPALFRKAVVSVLETLRRPGVAEDVKGAALHSIIERIIYVKSEKRFEFYFWD